MPEPAREVERSGEARRAEVARAGRVPENRERRLETTPRSRVVLLGASNLTRAFPVVAADLLARLDGPLDVLAAIGRGRSYGRTSHFLARELPGILDCGLWRALDDRPRLETRALLADLGNDLVYGAEVGEIAAWIEVILDRLLAQDARCALVRLPLENIERISPARFWIARHVFYPGRSVEFDVLRGRALELDARTVEIAGKRGVALVQQRSEWYGVDPIHVLRRRREEVSHAWLGPIANPAPVAKRLASRDRVALAMARAEDRALFGRRRVRAQPCATLLDGTAISVY
jgi:hypothetical protein